MASGALSLSFLRLRCFWSSSLLCLCSASSSIVNFTCYFCLLRTVSASFSFPFPSGLLDVLVRTDLFLPPPRILCVHCNMSLFSHCTTTVVSEACPLLLTFQILLLVRRHWCARLVGSSLARDIEPQKGTTCDMVALWKNEVRTSTWRFLK